MQTQITELEAAIKTETNQAKLREMYVRLGKMYSEFRLTFR